MKNLTKHFGPDHRKNLFNELFNPFLNNLKLSFIRIKYNEKTNYVMLKQHIHREKLCKTCNFYFICSIYTKTSLQEIA